MQATRLAFALLFGALLIGVCLAKPSKKGRLQVRQGGSCPIGQFSCAYSDQCITFAQLCDGRNDCSGGEDESDEVCSIIKPGSKRSFCDSSQFTCNDGYCIPYSWKCDGFEDCFGGEDEADCRGSSCPVGQASCVYSDECITLADLCDGKNDCSGGEDESDEVCSIINPGSKRAPKEMWQKMVRKVKQEKRAQ